jgi:glutamine amidotransferase
VKNDIAIIDYGVGNLYSVEKAFAHLGAAVVVTGDPAAILGASKVVLPGVGAFGDCMRNLTDHGLADVVRAVAAEGTPLLGICVGLQFLRRQRGGSRGGRPWHILRPGAEDRGLRPQGPPHGWNSLDIAGTSALFAGMPANPMSTSCTAITLCRTTLPWLPPGRSTAAG